MTRMAAHSAGMRARLLSTAATSIRMPSPKARTLTPKDETVPAGS